MDSMIAKLRVALQLDSAAFESGTTRAANQVNALGVNMASAQARMASFSEGLILSSNAAQRAGAQMRAVNDNAGAMRAGLQSAGFQLQDMAVQFASGQRAGVIFAQQLPQLSGALSQMAAASGATSGVIGRLAGFMAGPWGVAVGVGVAVLSPLIAKLFDARDAANAGAKGIYNLRNALAQLKSAPMEALGRSQEKVLSAQGKLNNARNMAIPQGTSEASRASQMIAQQNRDRAISAAQFDLETANRELGILQMVQSKQDFLAKTAQPLGTSFTSSRSRGGGGSGRSSGRSTIGSAVNDELLKLQQTTNDILAAFKPAGDRASEQFSGRADKRLEALRTQLGDVNIAMEKYGIEAVDTNQKVGESFQQMADNSLNSLRELTAGIQSGDFLGILGGVVHLLENLGGAGLFGSKVQASVAAFRKVPGRAAGGPVDGGRMYMVGERGPELFVPGGSGKIVPNHKIGGSGGGGNVYHIQGNLLTPEFFAMIQQGNVAAAQAGGDIGFGKVARANSRAVNW